MKLIVHPVIATAQEEKEYYAERFCPPYNMLDYHKGNAVELTFCHGFNHRQELVFSRIGMFDSKESAVNHLSQ
jgi:hypothetical protein